MIELSDDYWIDKGNHKSVYRYPGDDSKCIKIIHKEPDSDINREMFYRKVLSFKKKEINLIPKYFGRVSTNLGNGYCFEYLRNHDGSNCQNLCSYMHEVKLEEKTKIKEIQDLLLRFKKDFLESVILTTDVDPWNFFIQKRNNESVIRIIDNIGSPVAIPLMYWVKPMAVYHNRRSWKRFCREQKPNFPHIFTKDFIEVLSSLD